MNGLCYTVVGFGIDYLNNTLLLVIIRYISYYIIFNILNTKKLMQFSFRTYFDMNMSFGLEKIGYIIRKQ